MSNLWTGQTVAFNPLFNEDELQGFAIVSSHNKVFYSAQAKYNSLLKEAKTVIVFDGYAIQEKLKDFDYTTHNLRTLYFQVKSQNRFRNLKELIRHEYFTESDSTYTYLDGTQYLEGAKQTIQEASFMRNFYIGYYKETNKTILKLDNDLLREFTSSEHIEVDQVTVRTNLSIYNKKIWTVERKIFNEIGYPIISLSQVNFKDQTNSLKKNFKIVEKYKNQFDNLAHYIDIEDLDLKLDVTGTSTGRIICRDESTGLFAPENQFKHIFKAPEGKTFISADYTKQEASILAVVTQDKRLQKDLEHKQYYAKLAKLIIGEADKASGKELFYAFVYGVSAKSLGLKLNIDEEEAYDLLDAMRSRYSSLYAWTLKAKTLKTNYYGRKLYDSTANAYIQSTAADIVRMKLLQTIEFNPFCVFSDNIIYLVDKKNVNQCKEEIKYILERLMPFKLKVLIKSSENLKF